MFPYTLDGRGDAAFPSALTAGPDVMVEFFSSGLPIATPTTFLVNVHTMTTYPLPGAVDQAGFMSRLDEVFQIAFNQGVPMANSKRRVLAIAPCCSQARWLMPMSTATSTTSLASWGSRATPPCPHAWQGQAAGYASGGSIYMRTAVKQVQLVSIQVPSLNAGCGGIDAYLGPFPISTATSCSASSNRSWATLPGTFFDLALQTTVPEMKQAKDFLQSSPLTSTP